MLISARTLEAAQRVVSGTQRELATYEPLPDVVPAKFRQSVLAMDSMPYAVINQFGCKNGFPGYSALAELAQLPEYRKIVSVLAEEMTRQWIVLKVTGDENKSERIQQLEASIRRYRLREAFRLAMEHDGYFGRGQLYVEVKTPNGALATDDPSELASPLFMSAKKIGKGALVAFRPVEPMWTYPSQYNSVTPLAKGFYQPESWWVMGNDVHGTRLLTFIARPVPDMLKAAYSFGGLSLTQLVKPYIDHWLRTRDSVSDIVHSFSIPGFRTNMQAALNGEPDEELIRRVDLFNKTRDNRGALVLDKETEEFFLFNVPLTGLDKLQAQAQEQMGAVSSIPLVKLLGITPSGLNASTDGEIRVFYDYVRSQQELQREPLKRAIDVIQLSEFGEIDPDIDFEFAPLYQLSELDKATERKTEAETDAVYVQSGVLSGEEVRKRIAADSDSPYHALELSDEPTEKPDPERDEADTPTD